MIYIKTLAGQQALKDRALLTPPQRAAFIQFDGKRALGDVLQSCARLGVTGADIDHMVLLGLLEPVSTLADTDTATAASQRPGTLRRCIPRRSVIKTPIHSLHN